MYGEYDYSDYQENAKNNDKMELYDEKNMYPRIWKGNRKYAKSRYISSGGDVKYPGFSFYTGVSDMGLEGGHTFLNGENGGNIKNNGNGLSTLYTGRNGYTRNRNFRHNFRNKENSEQNPHKKRALVEVSSKYRRHNIFGSKQEK